MNLGDFMHMAEVQISYLKETLFNQCIVMKKLYDELEEERNASATAASEALSMILRLQREKAAEKMEACQYKRMAEEKMHHIEESLAMLEELMQQKDMEISFLKYQLQACHRKLTSIGLNIPDIQEMRIYRSPSLSVTDASTNFHGCVRRNVSLPSLQLDQLSREMDLTEDGSPLTGQSIWRKFGDYTSHLSEKSEGSKLPDFYEESLKKAEDLNSLTGQSIWRKIGDYKNQLSEKCEGSKIPDFYGESLKQADEVNKMMKVLMQAKNNEGKAECESRSANNELESSSAGNGPTHLEEQCSSCSWHSALSSSKSCESTISGIWAKLHSQGVAHLASRAGDSENMSELYVPARSHLEAESNGSTISTPCVHDIFEVPESHKGSSPSEPYKKLLEKSISGTSNMFKLTDLMSQENMEYIFSDHNWLNMQFMGTHSGVKLPKPREGPSVHRANKLPRPKKKPTIDCNCTSTGSEFGISTSQSNLEQLRKRLQKLKDERFMKQEGFETGKEQYQLLQEIYKQLDSIESHLKDSSKELPPQDESSLDSVMEAVLSFSI